VVIAALIGALLFGERLGARRLLASVVVLGGVLLIAAG
jgi:drug/metabolite transporter (DMT)-like permease